MPVTALNSNIGNVGTAPLTLAVTAVTVTSTDSIVLPASTLRRSLTIFNRGTGLADLNFGAVAVAGQGLPIAAALSAGAQGGGYAWDVGSGCPQQSIHAVCAASVTTTLVVVEGT